MGEFQVHPIKRFASGSAAIRRPKEIACFSYDENHEFHLDDRSLSYYYTPRIGADLSRGFESFRQADDTIDEHLDSLLFTLKDLEQRTGSRSTADIVTWRGMMTKIMTAPYENFSGFEMNATRFQDSIFIEENNEYKLSSRRAQMGNPGRPGGPSQELMSFWGYKFEALSVIPDKWDPTTRSFIEGREDMIVSNHAQYCSVVKTGIGKTKLILGGEVDCIWDQRPADKDTSIKWVELKTSAELRSAQDEKKLDRKLLKFWAQSFLLSVPKVIIGFRSEDGILLRLDEVETHTIPDQVTQRTGLWDGNLCISFTAAFLEWLKSTITSDGIWRIRRRERSPAIEVFKVEEAGYGRVLLPEFVEWRKQDT